MLTINFVIGACVGAMVCFVIIILFNMIKNNLDELLVEIINNYNLKQNTNQNFTNTENNHRNKFCALSSEPNINEKMISGLFINGYMRSLVLRYQTRALAIFGSSKTKT